MIRSLQSIRYDLAVIGGGPAGMAAALKAAELGIEKIIIIERNPYLGGILPQCIHNGFGLKFFKKDLSGPEYCQIFMDKLKNHKMEILLSCTALSLQKKERDIEIIAASKDRGVLKMKARSAVLALGCRERTRGQIAIHGSRPAGIYTAGFIQKLVNIEGYLPGKNAVVLGSGDIGLIMARRLKLEGVHVKGVYEIMPFSTGLTRNIYQCLKDYGIGLHLSHTVTKIYGDKSLEAVEISPVGSDLAPLKGANRKIIRCDSLLLSVGLIPENELSKTCGIALDKNTQGPVVNESFHTSTDGVFACGNSLFVNDIVDGVTEDGFSAAMGAFDYLSGREEMTQSHAKIDVLPGENVAYVSPHKISLKKDVTFKIRAKIPIKDAAVGFESIDFQKKVKYVLPGELVRIRLEVKKLSQSSAAYGKISKINVSIRKDAR